MTPVFAHGHLRLYLLSILATADPGMHGYELIQALSDRFGGTYAPSAGTIYPRLAKLEEEGLVTKVSTDGRRTVYAITDAGRAELAAREDDLEQVEDDLTDSVRRLADEVRSSVNDAMRTLKAELAAAAREARDEAKEAGRTFKTEYAEAKGQSRANLGRAEAAINEFRSELRSELRIQVSKADLTDEIVAQLRTGLDEVKRSILKALK
jgi:DNA-binding PadR family transcriptional regulator